ncbi:CCR4-NOT transcription complex subunit 1-like [Schistocerca gregaria]|uniref:CCR4-NOT transcription complex subunit 1-like n=1 Tax=Schistocerca gregaria TaxID=7010 RepID=UPI00211DF2A5|nr:CCR4-NOT transcription complex subunit 1-like [Schistocerca gregaria]
MLANNMVALYDKEPQYLDSIFTVVKTLNIVYDVLDLVHCTRLSIELAFLAKKIRKQHTPLNNEYDMAGTILKAFRANEDHLSLTLRKKFEDFSLSFLNCSLEPKLNMSVSTISDGSTSKKFPLTIKEDADEYLRKLFAGKLSPENLVKNLKRKATISLRDRETVYCVIHTLLDDYIHTSNVSEEELVTRSITLGLSISHDLLSENYTQKILNAVLSDLENSPTSKKFKFAVCAIEQYHHRLYEWTFHFEKLLSIPHLPASCPELFKKLQTIHSSYGNSVPKLMVPVDQAQGGKANSKRSYENDDQANGGNNDAGIINQGHQQHSSGSGNGSSDSGGEKNNGPGNGSSDGSDGDYSKEAPVQMLARAMPEVKQPTEETRDQIQFILNNVSFQNLEEKTALLRKIIQPSHFDYFAQHIVVYRISKNANFQSLYYELIDGFHSSELSAKVLNWTYYSIKNLLASPKLLYVSERSILKNLGSWLGHLTLAREKPIFHRDLPIKDLILHAYKTDNLVAVLPFVSKILAKSEKSKIFKVPNPWLVAILRLYKELHGYPNLKQNLKFDIELLFQTLKIDLKTIEPSQFFHQYRLNNQSDQGVTNNGANYDRQPMTVKPLSKNSNVISFQQPIIPSVTCHWMPGLAQTPQLAQFFSQQLRIKQFLYATFDRAIEQIVNTVLDRVTAFATTTTQKIVLKDFAMESDETKLMRAAHCMVQVLSSSFTSVISRPSLKSFVEHVCHSQFTGFNDTIKQILQEAIEINLVVACSVIEKHVSKKAVTSIDQALRRAFEYRVMFREKQRQGSIQSFYDMEYLPKTGPYLPQVLPDLLKPQICASSQMAVYENFLRLNELMNSEDQAMQNQARQAQLSLQSQILHQPHQYIDAKVNNLGRKACSNQLPDKGLLLTNTAYSSLANVSNPACKAPKPSGNFELYDTAKAMHMFNNLIEELVTYTASYFDTSNKTLLDNPNISETLKRLTNFVAFQCQDRVAVAEKASCEVLELLYTSSLSNRNRVESQSIRSMYVHILFALARTSSAVTGCVTEWYARDKFQYDKEITLSFLVWQLIRPSYFDTVLVRNLEKGCNIAAVKFAVYIIKMAMLRTQMPMLAGSDIPHLLDELEIVDKRCPDLIPNGLLTAARSVQLFCPTMRARRTATQNDLFETHGKQPFFYPISSLTQRQQQLNRVLPSNILSWFSDWVGLCQNSSIEGPPKHVQHQYIQQLQSLGLISLSKNVVPETESAFYRGIIEASVLSYLLLSQAQSNIRLQLQLQIEPEKLEQSTTLALQPYLAPEACARLIFLIGTNHIDHNWFLQCALVQAASVISADHHSYLTEFNQRPYIRLFTTMLTLFDQHSASNKSIHLHFLRHFADFLFDCHPGKYPGFAFGWFELLSHKCFMPKLMKNHSAWPILHKLLLLQFNFIESCLAKGKFSEPIRALYEGMLRVFFVILHDNPDFLSGYYYTLCNALPPICVQLRNLILSATPANVKSPDLSSFSLDTHILSGTEITPILLSDYQNPIIESNLKNALDLYLKQPAEFEQFIHDLPSNLRFLPEISDKIGLNYDTRLIGSIVLYSGVIFLTRPKNNAVMELYRYLSTHLDTEGRYHLFNSFFDHLRYLNSHTYFFCGMLLHFWELSANSSQQPSNQQIIARIIFERVKCNPPHPWGLLMLCQEISKNPKYGFAHVIYALDLDNEDILQSLYAKGYFMSSFPEPSSSTLPL